MTQRSSSVPKAHVDQRHCSGSAATSGNGRATTYQRRSDRARNERLHVVTSLVSGDVPSTKVAAETLAKISGAKNVLVVAERSDELTWKSLRNVATVHLLEPGQLNTYDVLISDDVVFTQGALEAFLAGPATGKSAKGAATSAEAEVVAEPVHVEKKPAGPKHAVAEEAADDAAADAGESADDSTDEEQS